LTLEHVAAAYGKSVVLHDVSMVVGENEMVTLLGSNGAGKTTLMRAITGTLKLKQGRITLNDRRLDGMSPDRIAQAGVALVPEGRQIFSMLTVRENLLLAGHRQRRAKRRLQDDLDFVCTIFPELKSKWKAYGNELSGGQQQMVALGRAIMQRPRIVLLDEPSIGLSPLIVGRLPEMIEGVRERTGAAILLVEQDAGLALSLAQRGYVLQSGRIALSGSGAELKASATLTEIYLGSSDDQTVTEGVKAS
jgi:branched-chain amino acid transport system ATP-binding protein